MIEIIQPYEFEWLLALYDELSFSCACIIKIIELFRWILNQLTVTIQIKSNYLFFIMYKYLFYHISIDSAEI